MEFYVKSFLDYIKVKAFSKQSIAAYSQSLGLLNYFLKNRDLRTLTAQDFKEFQLSLYRKNYSSNSISSHLYRINSFLKYLRTSGYMIDSALKFEIPKAPRTLPRSILTRLEMKALLKVPNVRTDEGIRNRAILEVLYSTGIRLNEIANLTLHNVSLSSLLLSIDQGKGAKDRIVPIGREACYWLQKYLNEVRSKWCKDCFESALWLASIGRHEPIKAPAIHAIVRSCAASLNKRVTTHAFRHTCASHMVSNGANIISVQQLLGHTSLSTTQLYAHVAIHELKDSIKQHHPRRKTL